MPQQANCYVVSGLSVILASCLNVAGARVAEPIFWFNGCKKI